MERRIVSHYTAYTFILCADLEKKTHKTKRSKWKNYGIRQSNFPSNAVNQRLQT